VTFLQPPHRRRLIGAAAAAAALTTTALAAGSGLAGAAATASPTLQTLTYTATGPGGGLYRPVGVSAAGGTVYVSNTGANVVATIASGTTTAVAGSLSAFGEHAADRGEVREFAFTPDASRESAVRRAPAIRGARWASRPAPIRPPDDPRTTPA